MSGSKILNVADASLESKPLHLCANWFNNVIATRARWSLEKVESSVAYMALFLDRFVLTNGHPRRRGIRKVEWAFESLNAYCGRCTGPDMRLSLCQNADRCLRSAASPRRRFRS
ncbi:protein of unknown function [Bradyrhizobium vignae]|uniref:Uncharacterized protein n=1 Tax=Bradyrhizobium vignae TaxID=1549949 RepID=A0A2U3PUB1_9BRAD|nr:protein of unknown function [Bradyrhizobium vignae]